MNENPTGGNTNWLQSLENRVERLTWRGVMIAFILLGFYGFGWVTMDNRLDGLAIDVAGLDSKLKKLSIDVAVLKAGQAELKAGQVENRILIKEILERLPAKK